MDKVAGHKSAFAFLYPQIAAGHHMMLPVGNGHELYVEESGNPEGIPVIVLHGGPGGGCSPYMRRYFDPALFRIILFDQRGCGRSRPFASVDSNSTWDLVADIERIREALNVDNWAVFGGSWGATLALAYAQSHPERVRYLALRGVFLGQKSEVDWFYQGGAGAFWPEQWSQFVNAIPEDERDDLVAAYNRRLFSGNREEETKFGIIWARWENALASMSSQGHAGDPSADYARAFARLENHYFVNGCFFETDGQLLKNADRLAKIPGTIVQGRYDMICPPRSAYDLNKAWSVSRLHFVKDAGHALSEPGITKALVDTMDFVAMRFR
ncbi:prolyl aminopeptidase [Celeribacter arenosi]|uniref:Proline iminopeptidase n=1 Tax=Celeribacter arenosi TaxID=792649 RepID=A0ABP7JXH0_9RHOB